MNFCFSTTRLSCPIKRSVIYRYLKSHLYHSRNFRWGTTHVPPQGNDGNKKRLWARIMNDDGALLGFIGHANSLWCETPFWWWSVWGRCCRASRSLHLGDPVGTRGWITKGDKHLETCPRVETLPPIFGLQFGCLKNTRKFEMTHGPGAVFN